MIFNNSKFNKSWKIKTLNELGKFNRGKSKHRPRNDIKLFESGKYPLIQTGEIKAANLFINSHVDMYNKFGLNQSKLWPENTLCITIAANIAETALLGYPMCFPDSVVGFNAYPFETTELFMHYVFTYIKKSIQNSASGSIQDNINIEFLTSLKFRVPPIKYQKLVSSILYNIDAKIELNNRINSEFEALAKTIYDYWFVQFDFPNEKGKPYKISGGKMVWNETLKREVPEGWEVDFLGEFGVFKNGINYDPKLGGDTEAKIINIRNMSAANWFVSQHGLDNITLNENEVKNYLVTDNDILIARSGIPGATRIMYKYANNTIYCGFIIRYQVKINNLKNYLFFKLKDLEKSITSKSSGTIMSNVNQETLKSYKIVLASEKYIKSFNKIIDPIFKAIDTNSQANHQLAELRDWLLPMLMNGQVKVRDADGEEIEEGLSMAAEPQAAYGNK